MFFFASCVYLRGILRVILATQRKSPRKFNLRPLATTCRSVWPGLYWVRFNNSGFKETDIFSLIVNFPRTVLEGLGFYGTKERVHIVNLKFTNVAISNSCRTTKKLKYECHELQNVYMYASEDWVFALISVLETWSNSTFPTIHGTSLEIHCRFQHFCLKPYTIRSKASTFCSFSSCNSFSWCRNRTSESGWVFSSVVNLQLGKNKDPNWMTRIWFCFVGIMALAHRKL